MDNSAFTALNSTRPNSPMTFREYYGKNPEDIFARIDNFFTGNVSNARQAYDNYLKSYENAYTSWREDTAVQRQMKDAAAAGINPLSILAGSAPSGAASSASAEYSRKDSKSTTSNSLINSAMKIIALLALKG